MINRTTLADGTEIAWQQFGNGLPLVLLHGFPLDGRMWSAQAESLAAHCQVIVPDLRGFGESTLGDVGSHGVAMQTYAADVVAVLDALDIAEPVVLCGFSMGGYVAWQFAENFADRLRALVLVDTRAVADTAEGRAGRLKMAETVAADGSAAVAEAMMPKLVAEETFAQRPQVVEAVRNMIAESSPAAIAAALRGMAARPDMTDRLPQIAVPTLLVGGVADAISSPDEMRGIAERMPDASFVEIADAGHMSPMENPAAVNRAIESFVASLAE